MDELTRAVRQYKYNDGSDGFVIAYDKAETEKVVKGLQDDLNKADELHFDECVEFEVKIAELKRELLIKNRN